MGERGAERRRGGNEIEPMAILSEHGNTWESLASFLTMGQVRRTCPMEFPSERQILFSNYIWTLRHNDF